MANVWQANYWVDGSKAYHKDNSYSKELYDKDTGYCDVGNLGDMRVGSYGGQNVTCLRFECNDSSYSSIKINCYNSSGYSGSAYSKILVRTSEVSSVTRATLEGLGAYTKRYLCANGSLGENNLTINYNFVKNNVYYIYIWGDESTGAWRFRWYAPTTNNYGFSVTYTVASYKFSITGDTGVASVTGSGTYVYGSQVTTTATAKTGYHLVSYTGQAADGTGSNTWTGCAGSSTHTITWTINADRTIKVNSTLKTYTLSYTNPAGATITVTRNGLALSNGATITHFNELTISVTASTGYNIKSIKVNGSDFTSGNTHTVVDNVKIEVTTTLKTYTLSYSNPTGATITVTRNGSPLSTGATISHFDVLTISVAASTGYNILSINVNSSAFTSGSTHTVSGNVTVSVATSLKTYTLTISQGTGTSITVVKNGSTTLSNNATITHFDELTVTITANTGYKLSSQSHTSGSKITVSGNVTVSAAATVLSYTLKISAGDGTKISVNRTSSPKQGASTGVLSDNATIYYSDVLSIATEALSGYRIIQQSHNDGSYTVTNAISVSATAELLGLVYIHNGTSWIAYEIYIDNGSKFERYIPHIDDGSKWNICI
jgi:hypothetical protein